MDRLRHRGQIGGLDPEAGHAGVDLEVEGERAREAHRARGAGEGLELPTLVDHGDETTRDDLAVRRAIVTAHHQDRRGDARVAELDRFLEKRDAEAIGARALEGARDRGSAVAVCVGLEHRPDLGRLRGALHDAQVVAERIEKDLGAGGANGVGGGRATRPLHAGLARAVTLGEAIFGHVGRHRHGGRTFSKSRDLRSNAGKRGTIPTRDDHRMCLEKAEISGQNVSYIGPQKTQDVRTARAHVPFDGSEPRKGFTRCPAGTYVPAHDDTSSHRRARGAETGGP